MSPVPTMSRMVTKGVVIVALFRYPRKNLLKEIFMDNLWRLFTSISVVVAALVGFTGPSVVAFAEEQPRALRELIGRAKKEGQVVYVDLTGTPEKLRESIQGFKKKFGVNIKVEIVPLGSSAGVTRLVQENAANKITMDLLHPSYTLVQRLVGKGILADFDWNGVFGKALPGISDASAKVPQFLKNKVLDYQHLVVVPIYNTKLLDKSDIPKKWIDLLDPKWKGKKIIMDPRGGSIYLFFVKYGEQWTLDYASKLMKQGPMFQRGQPAIARAVARGEAPLGITSLHQVLKYKHQGRPVDFAPMELAPVVPQVLVPVKGSRHPNAAKLFAAWLATEGLLIKQKKQFYGRAWPGSNWILAKTLEQAGVKLAIVSTSEEIKAAKKISAKVRRIVQRK